MNVKQGDTVVSIALSKDMSKSLPGMMEEVALSLGDMSTGVVSLG